MQEQQGLVEAVQGLVSRRQASGPQVEQSEVPLLEALQAAVPPPAGEGVPLSSAAAGSREK